jgi:hypothetical protein
VGENVLASRNFASYSDSEELSENFFVTMPFDPSAARLVLINAGIEYASLSLEGNAPSVTVVSPTGGQVDGAFSLTWTASDPDEDPLTYQVLYSPDGGTSWQILAAGIDSTSTTVDAGTLAGTQTGAFKVIASDGALSGEDTSDSPITIGEKPPRAVIYDPLEDLVWKAGYPLRLEGVATDLEDGILGEESLIWESDIDGQLGTGTEIEVLLSEGTHTITLTATDSDGMVDTANVVIESAVDSDDDAVLDPLDNCPLTANPDQLDTNQDGVGDACETYAAVGGIAELPDVGAAAGGSSSPPYVALAGAAVGVALLAAGGWYARRRWRERRET